LSLSLLYRYAEVLGVPVIELLVDPPDELNDSLKVRSQLLLSAKSVQYIASQSKQPSIRRMAGNAFDQLVQIMPELATVVPWPSYVPRDRELGATAINVVPVMPSMRSSLEAEASSEPQEF
jgi:hypothetical protein